MHAYLCINMAADCLDTFCRIFLQNSGMQTKLANTYNSHILTYAVFSSQRMICKESRDVDTLLRTGAGPFTDAVLAFRKNPVDARDVRVALLGTFALGQVTH
jgi:hypothetical protein